VRSASSEGGAVEHHLEVTRTARYYTLGPLSADEVWFVFHGYRQLAGRFVTYFRSVDDGSRCIVAPEALSRFYIDRRSGPHGPEHRVGATWMTREHRLAEIRDYVRYLDSLSARVLGDRRPGRLVVLGFSQGTHTASRWTVLGRIVPDELVLWGGSLPLDLDMERAAPRLRGLGLTVVRGDEDHLVPEQILERQAQTLEEWRVPWRRISFTGGHRLDKKVLKRLAG
jgi:predicted esterase